MKKYHILLTLLAVLSLSVLQAQEAFGVKVSGQGPDLFLIPGAACPGEVWQETVARYESHYTCHVFTLAGYAGQAPLAESPMLPQIKDQLVAYIKSKDSKKPIIMGHSIGGFLSLWIASENPKLFDKVLIVDALPFYAALQNPMATEAAMEQYIPTMVSQYMAMDSNTYLNTQKGSMKIMTKSAEHQARAVNWSVQSDRRALAQTVGEMMALDLRQEIAQIKSETLVLCAWDGPYENAPMLTLDFIGNGYKDQYKAHRNCEVVVAEEARHFIMWDNPKWFFAQVDAFLKFKS